MKNKIYRLFLNLKKKLRGISKWDKRSNISWHLKKYKITLIYFIIISKENLKKGVQLKNRNQRRNPLLSLI